MIRHAAVRSIDAFKDYLRPVGGSPNTSDILLDLYLALYDTLNDDDEEIRGLGAAVVSWILSTTTTCQPLTPLAAAFRFSTFLAQSYANSQHLFARAFLRIAGKGSDDNGPRRVSLGHKSEQTASITPFRDMLTIARKQDNSLFVEERQNLFMDDLREAEIWSRVLSLLSHDARDEALVAHLFAWVTEGLSDLTEMARIQFDGPLGLTSKPEVFALGMHLILAAGLVQHWATAGASQIDDEAVKGSLKDFMNAALKNSLHPTWIDRVRWLVEGKAWYTEY